MQQCPPAVVGGASANAAVSAGGCGRGPLLMQQCRSVVVGGASANAAVSVSGCGRGLC